MKLHPLLDDPQAVLVSQTPVNEPVRLEAYRGAARQAMAAMRIDVPKLKTHNLAITTLCLKNMMGAVNVFDRHYCHQAWDEIPEEMRDDARPRHEWMDEKVHELWQEGLARRLNDTAKVAPPHLNIVEGMIGRDGTGFNQGRNFPLGLVIAGVNMVAVDSVASYLMGFDPAQLIYLRMAAEAGLGDNDLAKLRIYAVRDGAIMPCPDMEALRADPPLRVIRGIAGEGDPHAQTPT